jgi:hypothetical protein
MCKRNLYYRISSYKAATDHTNQRKDNSLGSSLFLVLLKLKENHGVMHKPTASSNTSLIVKTVS